MRLPKTTLSQGMPVKLGEAISWLKGTLQGCLFPDLEECRNAALTDKERQLVSILELVQVEGFVVRKADNQWLGRKLLQRESMDDLSWLKRFTGIQRLTFLLLASKHSTKERWKMAFILIFDEEVDYGLLLKRLLESSGNTVVAFSERSKTREWMNSNFPDLVIVNSSRPCAGSEDFAQCLQGDSTDSSILIISRNGFERADNKPKADVSVAPLGIGDLGKKSR